MLDAKILVEDLTKKERQSHIKLEEPCVERGGNSTNHKGVLAEYLGTTIPSKTPLLCHACNNDKCSNPRHLYWGSHKENVEDAIINGTHSSCTGKLQGWLPGRKHTEASKRKISNSLKGKPSNNPSGKNGNRKGYTFKLKHKYKWITDGINNTRIREEYDIPEGWYRGKIEKKNS